MALRIISVGQGENTLDISSEVAMSPLRDLMLWLDPCARTGAECMAVDEALLESAPYSILRIYHWGRPTVTYGYFDRESVARNTYCASDIDYVRRWTGGGIVDHRYDIPFTLALLQPKGTARMSSAQLYRWIHGTLARVLRDCGTDCVMLTEDAPEGNRSCFNSPVTSDIVDMMGEKLAGGGQRRTRRGVLHQGSIQSCCLPSEWGHQLAHRFADNVMINREIEPVEGLNQRVEELLQQRYLTQAWRNGARHAAQG